MDLADRVTTVKFVLRDRDSRVSRAFAADGIRILTSPPGAPRANAICERMIANPAPRAARQGSGGQRTPPTPDHDDLPAPFQRRTVPPNAGATRPCPSQNPATTSDRPR